MMSSSTVDNKHKTRLGRRVASLSLIFGLIFAYNFILFDEDDYSHVEESKNGHRQLDATEDQPAASTRRRKLLGSNNGPLPPPRTLPMHRTSSSPSSVHPSRKYSKRWIRRY